MRSVSGITSARAPRSVDLPAPEPLDVHLIGSVHQDVADGRIGQQRRERTHPDRLVRQLFGEAYALRIVERNFLRLDGAGGEVLYGRGHIRAVAVEQPTLPDF